MLLFLDESGTDHGATPYEVTGGVAVWEKDLWPLILEVERCQRDCFGGLLRDLAPAYEAKATTLLAKDKFAKAGQGPPMPDLRRQGLARAFLEQSQSGVCPRRDHFTAYGQACLRYVSDLLQLCRAYDVVVFASMLDRDAPISARQDVLRRDLAFLFERYAYYMEDLRSGDHQGLVGLLVFDELERAQCRRLLDRLGGYFVRTERGRGWSEFIIPEPFFVRSDLTTGTQIADIVVYLLNWGYRFGGMDGPVRPELRSYVHQVKPLIRRTGRADEDGRERAVWSVAHVGDLRGRIERADRT